MPLVTHVTMSPNLHLTAQTAASGRKATSAVNLHAVFVVSTRSEPWPALYSIEHPRKGSLITYDVIAKLTVTSGRAAESNFLLF